jgi:hypothetical protein
VHMVWLLYESRQPDWRDSNEPDLRNKFRPGSFLKIILKQGQNKKNPTEEYDARRGRLRCRVEWKAPPGSLGQLYYQAFFPRRIV